MNLQEDREAEEAIIAHCLINPADSRRMLAQVQPGDMLTDECKLAYGRIAELVDSGEEVNPFTVSKAGLSPTWLLDIQRAAVVSMASLDYWCGFTRRQGHARFVYQQAAKAMAAITDGKAPDDVAWELTQSLKETAGAKRSVTRSLKEVIEDSGWLAMESWMNDPKKLAGPSTGLPKLDTYIGGLGAGRLIAIGADTGIGKSAFVQHLARECVREMVPTQFISTEMNEMEVFFRLAFMEAGWDKLTVAVRGHTRDIERASMLDGMETMVPRPLLLTELRGMDIGALEAEVHRIKERHGLQVVILDLLNGLPTKGDNRAQGIAANTARLKQLAEAERVALIMTAHIDRASAKGVSEMGVHSFKDSGAIEQDADQAIILVPTDGAGNRLAREESSKIANNGNAIDVAVRICKNRHGAEATIFAKLHWGRGGRVYPADAPRGN